MTKGSIIAYEMMIRKKKKNDYPNVRMLEKKGKWDEYEHKTFVSALQQYGKDWKKIHQILPSRSLTQIRSHAQKYLSKHVIPSSDLPPLNNTNLEDSIPSNTNVVSTRSTEEENNHSLCLNSDAVTEKSNDSSPDRLLLQGDNSIMQSASVPLIPSLNKAEFDSPLTRSG